ncbi:helix-turn-helix domain-containing protein [Azoarcus communis]|uniref:anthranilate 1,2-dioxygenase regulatory protein AndR n=1 Tax=Parazoarcus communis TaxID=41977 RepID=UPI0014594676|nr:anthranilate 1,2-dioxygenase regulatory protein AndR [Parazoarcus communis]NMG49090.1 helix-turn-helix domain-containing protein [Parazoarcus communis]
MHAYGTSPEPVALRQRRYFESVDIDDTCIRISSILQPHRLEPTQRTRPIRSHMDVARIGSTAIGAIDFGDAMKVFVDEMEDYYLFVCCLRGHAEIDSMGERTTIGRDRGAVCIPGAKFHGRFSPDCEQFFMRVDRAALTAHTGVELMHFDHRLDLTSPALAPWLAQFRLLASQPEMIELAERNPVVAVEMERMLLTLLLAGQPHRPSVQQETTGIAPAIVRRAEAYIEAHACEPIRLGDIAAAVDVPTRTLLDGFQRFRDYSPMELVRRRRLTRARERLQSDATAVRVADVALDCGFGHIGRFSIAYREAFGEAPSDTLQRRMGSR